MSDRPFLDEHPLPWTVEDFVWAGAAIKDAAGNYVYVPPGDGGTMRNPEPFAGKPLSSKILEAIVAAVNAQRNP